jgi:hypothetical protein
MKEQMLNVDSLQDSDDEITPAVFPVNPIEQPIGTIGQPIGMPTAPDYESDNDSDITIDNQDMLDNQYVPDGQDLLRVIDLIAKDKAYFDALVERRKQAELSSDTFTQEYIDIQLRQFNFPDRFRIFISSLPTNDIQKNTYNAILQTAPKYKSQAEAKVHDEHPTRPTLN